MLHLHAWIATVDCRSSSVAQANTSNVCIVDQRSRFSLAVLTAFRLREPYGKALSDRRQDFTLTTARALARQQGHVSAATIIQSSSVESWNPQQNARC